MAMNLLCACGSCLFFLSYFPFPKVCQLFVSPHDRDEIGMLRNGGGLIVLISHVLSGGLYPLSTREVVLMAATFTKLSSSNVYWKYIATRLRIFPRGKKGPLSRHEKD